MNPQRAKLVAGYARLVLFCHEHDSQNLGWSAQAARNRILDMIFHDKHEPDDFPGSDFEITYDPEPGYPPEVIDRCTRMAQRDEEPPTIRCQPSPTWQELTLRLEAVLVGSHKPLLGYYSAQDFETIRRILADLAVLRNRG